MTTILIWTGKNGEKRDLKNIRLKLPNKNAKEVEVNGIKYIVPTITLYHRKYFANIDEIKESNIYEIINPIMRKIFRVDEDFHIDTFEYLMIQLFDHNKILRKSVSIDGEDFKVDDIIIKRQDTFEINDTIYKFRKPLLKDKFPTLLEGLNSLQEGTNYNFMEMDCIFFKVAVMVFGTIEVTGNKGSTIRGINNILDIFVDEEEFDKFRGV